MVPRCYLLHKLIIKLKQPFTYINSKHFSAKLKCSAMETVFNQSIWGDEGFSAILSMKSLPDIIKVISRDTSPPLWNIIEHFAFQIFGASEVVIRSLSFSFYLITAFFVFKIGSLLFSKKSGGIVVLLTLFNPFFFIYAFEGRM